MPNPVILSLFYCMYDVPFFLSRSNSLHFSHDRLKWCSLSFSTTFPNFQDIYDLLWKCSIFRAIQSDASNV